MKVVSKIYLLSPIEMDEEGVKIQLYRVDEEKWIENNVASENINIDKLLEVAAKEIVSFMPRVKNRKGYVFATAEIPGLSVTIGEGDPPRVETILSPKPEYLRRILFMKRDPSGNFKIVYEYRPSMESIIYDGYISFPPSIQHDIMLIETSENIRILLPHELHLSSIKSSPESIKKTHIRRRRQKRTRSKRK